MIQYPHGSVGGLQHTADMTGSKDPHRRRVRLPLKPEPRHVRAALGFATRDAASLAIGVPTPMLALIEESPGEDELATLDALKRYLKYARVLAEERRIPARNLRESITPLERLRHGLGLSQAQVACALRCSEGDIERAESIGVGPVNAHTSAIWTAFAEWAWRLVRRLSRLDPQQEPGSTRSGWPRCRTYFRRLITARRCLSARNARTTATATGQAWGRAGGLTLPHDVWRIGSDASTT